MVHLGSIIGGILLSGGLYSVLWGKSKENKTKNIEVIVSNRASQDDELVHMGVEEKEKKNSEEERDVSSAFVVGQVRTIG
nr:unnamed protein product [Digitaria exilis]